MKRSNLLSSFFTCLSSGSTVLRKQTTRIASKNYMSLSANPSISLNVVRLAIIFIHVDDYKFRMWQWPIRARFDSYISTALLRRPMGRTRTCSRYQLQVGTYRLSQTLVRHNNAILRERLDRDFNVLVLASISWILHICICKYIGTTVVRYQTTPSATA